MSHIFRSVELQSASGEEFKSTYINVCSILNRCIFHIKDKFIIWVIILKIVFNLWLL